MEDESLSDTQKLSENQSFMENKMKSNIQVTRYSKRLNTFTISQNLAEKNFTNKAFKQFPLSRNTNRKRTIYSTLFNYNKSANKIKNIKLQLQPNITPTLSTFENERENTQSNIEKEKMKNMHKKIYNIYNAYYKAYKLQVAKNKQKDYESLQTEINKINRNRHKTFIFQANSSTVETVKKSKLSNQRFHSRSIETKSKTSKIKTLLKTSFQFQSPQFKNRKHSYNLLRTESDKRLREKVNEVVREIDHNKKKEYIPKVKSKEARARLVSLLNRKKGIVDETLNLLSKKKMAKNDPFMLVKKPTNNIEMNNLIINSFGVGNAHIEFSKKLYDLNEVFFSLLENMKIRRTEIDIARFEKAKRKYENKDYHKINFESYYQRNNRDRWEKRFMLDQYEYRIPETEFQKFKRYERAKDKKIFMENAKKLSNLITKLDADEYEAPDEVTHNYRSTKSNISSINYKRISRLLKILKNNEDEEQTGNIILKADYLKKEQRINENQMINVIGKSGKPRFVKNLLKPRTVNKYKSISGNFFGLPV